MGFYGDTIYYLPNGIAQNVVDGCITPRKLDRGYLEYEDLTFFDLSNEPNKELFYSSIDKKTDLIAILQNEKINNKLLRFEVVKPEDDFILPIGNYLAFQKNPMQVERKTATSELTEEQSYNDYNFSDLWIIWDLDTLRLWTFSTKEGTFKNDDIRFKRFNVTKPDDIINNLPCIDNNMYSTIGIVDIQIDNKNNWNFKYHSNESDTIKKSITLNNDSYLIMGYLKNFSNNIYSEYHLYSLSDLTGPQYIVQFNKEGENVQTHLVQINTASIAPGSITTSRIDAKAVTQSKIASTAIHGANGNNQADTNQRASHIAVRTISGEGNKKDVAGDIAFDTITGGADVGQGNIAGGTIQNYNILDHTIQPAKLDRLYWNSNEPAQLHVISNYLELLDALPYDFVYDGTPCLALIYIDNIEASKWNNNIPIFPKGYYIGLRNYGEINLIGYRYNWGANYSIKLKDSNNNDIFEQSQHTINADKLTQKYWNIFSKTINEPSELKPLFDTTSLSLSTLNSQKNQQQSLGLLKFSTPEQKNLWGIELPFSNTEIFFGFSQIGGFLYLIGASTGAQYILEYDSSIGKINSCTRVQLNSEDIIDGAIYGCKDEQQRPSKIAKRTIGETDIAYHAISGTYHMASDSDNPNLGNLALYTIGESNMGKNAISRASLQENSVCGRNKFNKYHIVEESISGGENGDIAGNTITNYNIAPGTIERDRLANDYLEYIYYNPDDGITFDSLKAYLRNGEATGPKKNNILISFQLAQDIDYLSKGNYCAVPCPLDGSYIGGQVFWHLTNLNTKQEWIWNVHGNIQELKNTDINIAEDAIKDYHIDNNQIHGSGDNLDHPSYQHIAEKSIGTNDIADKAIKRNQINDWAVQKEHIAGHAIQGLASDDVFILTDGTKKSHIAPESIAGGVGGDIAPETITNYNILPNSIENDRLSEKYYSHIESTEPIVNLEHLITKLQTLRDDQKLYFSISPNGDLYQRHGLSLTITYCAEKKANWIIYPCNTNNSLILNYYIISDLEKTLAPVEIKIGSKFIESNSINGSAFGISHIKEKSIDTNDIADGAITAEKLDKKYLIQYNFEAKDWNELYKGFLLNNNESSFALAHLKQAIESSKKENPKDYLPQGKWLFFYQSNNERYGIHMDTQQSYKIFWDSSSAIEGIFQVIGNNINLGYYYEDFPANITIEEFQQILIEKYNFSGAKIITRIIGQTNLIEQLDSNCSGLYIIEPLRSGGGGSFWKMTHIYSQRTWTFYIYGSANFTEITSINQKNMILKSIDSSEKLKEYLKSNYVDSYLIHYNDPQDMTLPPDVYFIYPINNYLEDEVAPTRLIESQTTGMKYIISLYDSTINIPSQRQIKTDWGSAGKSYFINLENQTLFNMPYYYQDNSNIALVDSKNKFTSDCEIRLILPDSDNAQASIINQTGCDLFLTLNNRETKYFPAQYQEQNLIILKYLGHSTGETLYLKLSHLSTDAILCEAYARNIEQFEVPEEFEAPEW